MLACHNRDSSAAENRSVVPCTVRPILPDARIRSPCRNADNVIELAAASFDKNRSRRAVDDCYHSAPPLPTANVLPPLLKIGLHFIRFRSDRLERVVSIE